MIPITCNAVGDILALAELLVDVVRALNDARGSALEYRTFTRELDGLRTMLTTAARVAEDSADRALRDEIIREVDQCGRDVQLALARIAKFSELGHGSSSASGMRARLARHRYKLEWRFFQRDDVQTVRKELATATQRLTTLLVLSNACVCLCVTCLPTCLSSLYRDGATHFQTALRRQFSNLLSQHATLSRAVHEHIGEMRSNTRRINRTLVQDLYNDVPEGLDGKTAAVAVMCAAVCAMHGPYDRAVPTALLLVAIYILLQSSGRQGRALAQGVAYSHSNAVTFLDALGRRLILPFELCETPEVSPYFIHSSAGS